MKPYQMHESNIGGITAQLPHLKKFKSMSFGVTYKKIM